MGEMLNQEDWERRYEEEKDRNLAITLQLLLTEADSDSQKNNPNNVIIGEEIISEPGAVFKVTKLTVAPGLLNTEAERIPGSEDFQEANDTFTLSYWYNFLQRFLKVK